MADFSGTAGKDNYAGTDSGDLISGGAGGDTLSGAAGDDYIASGERPPNFGVYFGRAISIDTGTERDTLIGGAGNDHFYAGYGDNVDGGIYDTFGNYLSISFLGAAAGVTVDFTKAVIKIGGGTIQNIQHLTFVQGSNFADTINAEDHSNGYTEYTTVLGMGGNDKLTGGYYTDLIDGGDGDDLVDGRPSQYLRELRGGKGNDTIYSEGYSAAIYGDAGNDTIYTGSMTHGGAGDDRIIVGNTGYRDFIFGDDGDDTITAQSYGELTVIGGAGRDTITGADARDVISTGSPPDVIEHDYADDLTAERDTVSAGGGDDLIAAGIRDVIDGGAGTDTLRLSLAGARTGITLSTAGMLTRTAPVFGGGSIKGIEVLQYLGLTDFADKIEVAATDLPQTLDAGGGNDVIEARGLSLTILGGAGDDRLIGGNAAGLFDGGDGIDTVNYGTATARVIVQMVDGVGGGMLDGVGQLVRVEIVNGSAFNDRITGNAEANTLNGLGGNDTLAGGLGADTLYGGAGADRLVGGADDDTYIIDDTRDTIVESAGEGNDTVRAAIDWKLGSHTENLVLTGNALNGRGNSEGNVLTGNAGANTLLGLGGADVLIGGKGIDVLDGGAGGDIYLLAAQAEQTQAEIGDTGASGLDELRFAAASGSYKAFAGDIGIERIVAGTGLAAAADTSGTGAVNLDASALGRGVELIGNAGVNALIGTAFADQIDGGAGADTLTGGKGNDTYFVDSAADRIAENAGEGTDTVISGITWTLGANVDNLTLTGSIAIDGIGNALDNVITGNDGANVLIGGGGRDRLVGGLGNDSYLVESGTETVVEAAQGGFDRVITSVSMSLGANIEVGVAKGTAGISITGSAAGDMISGNSGNNVLSGGEGADTLFGQGGNDTLRGDGGADFLYGGYAADTLTGGAGADQFVAVASNGQLVDRITDFVSGTDTLLVVNPYVSGYLLDGGLVFGTSARDENDVGIYDQSSGNLWVDYDGNGSGAKELLVTFTPGTVIAASDFVLIDNGSFLQQTAAIDQAFSI